MGGCVACASPTDGCSRADDKTKHAPEDDDRRVSYACVFACFALVFVLTAQAGISKKAVKLRPVAVIKG